MDLEVFRFKPFYPQKRSLIYYRHIKNCTIKDTFEKTSQTHANKQKIYKMTKYNILIYNMHTFMYVLFCYIFIPMAREFTQNDRWFWKEKWI